MITAWGISCEIALRLMSLDFIDDKSTLVQSMAWCPSGNYQGAVSIRKTVFPGMAIPMLKIRRPNGRLIFNMEIAIHR